MFTFDHFNFNVLDLARSVQFYHDALGLEPVRTKDASDGSFRLVFLGDGHSPFQLELTWLRDRGAKPYDLGECEFHLAFVTDQYDALYAKHKEMGCVCFVNERMGISKGFDFIQEADIPQIIDWALAEANPNYPVPVVYNAARCRKVIDTIRAKAAENPPAEA